MGVDDARRNGETKAKAAVLAGRAAVGLAELVEHEGQEVRRDADPAVANFEDDLAVLPTGGDGDVAIPACELDRIVHEVGEQLAQPGGIAEHGKRRILDGDLDADRLGRRTRTQHRDSIRHHGRDRHAVGRELELAARDSRDVEQILDEPGLQQRIPFDHLDGVLGATAPVCDICAYPRITFNGVRSSCESVARN